MPDNGYGAGLFNPQGPKDFATAVSSIAGSLKEVVAGFTTLSSQASDVIGGLETRINKLCQEMQACKQSMAQGWNIPSSATAGATVGGSAATGAQSGQGQPSTNQAGITPGAQWQSAPAGPGGGGTGSAPGTGVPQGTASNGPGSFASQGNVSPGGGGGYQYPPGANNPPTIMGGGPGGTPPMGGGTANGGGVAGAALGALPVVGKGLQSLLGGGLASAALQGNVIGSQAQTWFGNGGAARGMQVMNGNMWAVSPQDYIQANAAGMYSGMYTPGTSSWNTFQGNVRTGQILSGGALNATQSAQASIGMYSAQNINTQQGFGIQMTPGGNMSAVNQQQDFDKIIAAVFKGGTPSAQDMQAAFRQGSYMDIAAQKMLHVSAGDPLYIEFQNYAMTKASQGAKNKAMPNLPTASTKQLQTSGLWNQGMAQLKAQSGEAQIKSQALPAISDINTHLDNLSATIEKWINVVAGPAGKGASGAIGSILGTLPGGATMNVGAQLIGKIPGMGFMKHFQEGGLVTPSSDSVPAMLTPGEYVLPKNLTSLLMGAGSSITKSPGLLSSPGGQTASSTMSQLMISTLSDLESNSVANVLFSSPGRNTVLAQLLSQGPSGGGGGGPGPGGGAGGGSTGSGGTGASSSAGSSWSYKSASTGPQDLSGMFSNSSGSSQSSSSNNGGSSSAAASNATSAAVTKLTGSTTAQQIWNFLIGKGLKDYEVAGIIGNMAQESSVNPESVGDGGGGLVGWTPLPKGLVTGNAQADLLTQLNYLWSELNGSESGALSALKGTSNAADAATVFMNKFERPYVPTENAAHRVSAAQNSLASKGAGYARGSQYIARTQLALLHRGEAVVPAADNYSATPYNRNGSSGGGAPIVHLHFKSGSIQLVVPANSSQQDMEKVAQQFVKAVSKPQVLASVRSS